MRVTFLLLRRGYVRNFASCIEGLLANGHEVHLGFDMPEHSPTGIEERLAERYPGLTWDEAPKRDDRWVALLYFLRGMIDVIRYYHPDYRDAPALRRRLAKKGRRYIGDLVVVLDRVFAIRSSRSVKAAIGLINRLQFRLPASASHLAYFRSRRPDVVMVTPLVNIASEQVDHVEAANELGIPTIAAIASWDNLTNKGLLRCRPDRVLVWNRPQKHEAERYHYIAPDRITVTGAHTFDRWIGRKPAVTREEFLARIGLDSTTPFVAFMCSSNFITRQEEAAFVRRWIAAIRASDDARVSGLGILVRPHFQNAGQWDGVDLADTGNTVIYPRGGANPVNPASEEDFFDTLHFAGAVVGVNTTAMIEAGIIGRPVMSIETDQFATTQSGSLHFRYLREGGLLKYATGMEQHLRQLAETLENPPEADANLPFLDYFIRCPDDCPSATARMVQEIELVAAMRKAPVRRGAADWLVRAGSAVPAAILSGIRRAKEERRQRKSAAGLTDAGKAAQTERNRAETPWTRLRRYRRAAVKRISRLAGSRRAARN